MHDVLGFARGPAVSAQSVADSLGGFELSLSLSLYIYIYIYMCI